MSSLCSHEQRMNHRINSTNLEQALQSRASIGDHGGQQGGKGCGLGRGRGRHNFNNKDEDGDTNSFKGRDNTSKPKDKSHIQCFRCKKYGHYKLECRTKLQNKQDEQANTTEMNMVTGLPMFDIPIRSCEGYLLGKQHRNSFLVGRSKRVKQPLELVYIDIFDPGGEIGKLIASRDVQFLENESWTWTQTQSEKKGVVIKEDVENKKDFATNISTSITSCPIRNSLMQIEIKQDFKSQDCDPILYEKVASDEK
ncbi:hypothetical protein CK203_114902 [Vitis vinifera]|uniref:CCHC-type domain-containing protein n=1 Tax=Vitis vinifera TaxID=29760 RepID=A0A438C461_VITVI|nr:hypothetical protein CK203_114902 [Vitis vinifera]